MKDSELDPAAILSRARSALSPSDADRARVLRAVTVSLSESARSGLSPADGAAAVGTPQLSGLVKLSVALTFATATGIGGYALGYRAGVAQRVTAPAPATLARETPSSGIERPSLPNHVPAPPAPSSAAPVTETSADSSLATPNRNRFASSASAGNKSASGAANAEPALELETRLLSRVERALREQNPRFALGLLGELDREVPGGQLREERDAARVVAHCELDSDAAPKLKRDFTTRYAGSAYLARIAQACARTGAEQ